MSSRLDGARIKVSLARSGHTESSSMVGVDDGRGVVGVDARLAAPLYEGRAVGLVLGDPHDDHRAGVLDGEMHLLRCILSYAHTQERESHQYNLEQVCMMAWWLGVALVRDLDRPRAKGRPRGSRRRSACHRDRYRSEPRHAPSSPRPLQSDLECLDRLDHVARSESLE